MIGTQAEREASLLDSLVSRSFCLNEVRDKVYGISLINFKFRR